MLSFALSRSNAEAMPEAPKKEENFQESPVHDAPSPQAAPALELPHGLSRLKRQAREVWKFLQLN